jgi:hypothetical protein
MPYVYVHFKPTVCPILLCTLTFGVQAVKCVTYFTGLNFLSEPLYCLFSSLRIMVVDTGFISCQCANKKFGACFVVTAELFEIRLSGSV